MVIRECCNVFADYYRLLCSDVRRSAAARERGRHWTVMLSDPVAQLVPDAREAVMVAVPGPTKSAKPFGVEKLTTEVSLDVQVVLLVTSEPFSAAVNC